MSRNIVPRIDKGADLGTAEKNWNKLYADAVILRGNDLRALLDTKIDLSTAIAKGDLFVATGAGMITRFPRGADGEVLVSNSQTNEGLDWVPADVRQTLTSGITINVGTGGDFPTINDALAYCVSMYYPTFLATGSVPKVTINLLSGFVMNEQVIVDYLNLSWITIVGVDPETVIRREALTRSFANGAPAFCARNGGFLPIINQVFSMDESGESYKRHGIWAYSNSRAIVSSGRGAKNSSGYDIFASNSSIIEANGAGVLQGTKIVANYGSIIDAQQASAKQITAAYGSIVNASNATASGPSNDTFTAAYGSIINANSATTSGFTNYGFSATHGSIINAISATASEDGQYGFFVHNGGIIAAYGATGTLSKTANEITMRGIIFQ